MSLFDDADGTEFGTILADPPWDYQNWTDSKNGAAASAYETMPVADIAAIPVQLWSSKDSILLLWATWPKLDEGLEVLRAWGFTYVTAIPWCKYVPGREVYTGIGFWAQSMSELLLIGRRGGGGKAKSDPVKGLLCGSEVQFWAPRGAHSEKPIEIHAWAQRVLPGPHLELFARRRMPGWTCWGLDLGHRLDAEGMHLAGEEVVVEAAPPRAARTYSLFGEDDE